MMMNGNSVDEYLKYYYNNCADQLSSLHYHHYGHNYHYGDGATTTAPSVMGNNNFYPREPLDGSTQASRYYQPVQSSYYENMDYNRSWFDQFHQEKANYQLHQQYASAVDGHHHQVHQQFKKPWQSSTSTSSSNNYTVKAGVFANCLNDEQKYPKLATAYQFHQHIGHQLQQQQQQQSRESINDNNDDDNRSPTHRFKDAEDSPALRALLTNKRLKYEPNYVQGDAEPERRVPDLENQDGQSMEHVAMTLQNMTPPLSPVTNNSDGSPLILANDWSAAGKCVHAHYTVKNSSVVRV